ncbi:MAG: SDR family oxidoreductase [Candidatus Eisenbacteria bacterium]|uniref:SDR family oxidoreductase n=1 Tax=Eiseniibacteriota bacterium TaxID=2212470 RepID=A0A7Y2ECH5_UNCEI|nr:SDR family oxidoreductase [Candidatus Eisenbacteria bacterium]
MSSQVALVTGGARGIPRAIAVDLAKNGWSVAICYRKSKEDAENTLAEIHGANAYGMALQADVSDPLQCKSLVDSVRQDLGPITALINGAGPYHRVPILKETPEGWREMFDHNLHAAFYMSQLVVPDMQSQKFGRIINFAMANADRIMAQPMVTAHFIAKSGLLILTRTLGKKLAPHGITVNAISPGFIDSGSADADEMDSMLPKIPAGRLGSVEDAVQSVRWLMSKEAEYVNGSNIHLSGGWGM